MYFNYENETLQISHTLKEEINSNFRIKKIINNSNISYYSIMHVNTNLNLIYSIDNMKNLFLDLIHENEENALWNFIELENNNYIIHNKKNCYLKIKELNISCDNITMEEASQFNLIKIYEEITDNIINYKLIEKEPIDVLIKYIDLRDPFLKRKGIFQTKKDLENEELRYCIRSILKNIPWVRKIFILMPNEKVRFFKNYSFISDKIVYVKDKDILGHDSSNSLAFQFRFWKLEKYGISDNFIAMDDDYFIGQPLNKTNFFYDINGKIKPLTITSKFTKINKKVAKQKLIEYKEIINQTDIEQTSPVFRYSLYLTYFFILELFGDSLYIPVHTHNAIPVNLKELKEIYYIVYQSKYKYGTLYSLYRIMDNIQFQTFVVAYNFYKYKKKVRNIPHKLINNKNTINAFYNYSLFCINTGSFKIVNYTDISFMITKIVMEYLFPVYSPFEKINFNDLPDLAFNTIYIIENNLRQYKMRGKYKIKKLEDQLKSYQNQILYLLYFSKFIVIIILVGLKKYFIIKNKNKF